MDMSLQKEHINCFVIASGDSDFSPLVSKLKENNKYVIGLGVKNSTSDLLMDNCDEFIFYEDLVRGQQRQVPAIGNLPEKQQEVYSLLVDSRARAAAREQGDPLGLHGQGDHEAQEAVVQRDVLRLPHLQPPPRGGAAQGHRAAPARPEVGQLRRRGPRHGLRDDHPRRDGGGAAPGGRCDARAGAGARCRRRGPAAAAPAEPADAANGRGRSRRRPRGRGRTRTTGAGGPVPAQDAHDMHDGPAEGCARGQPGARPGRGRTNTTTSTRRITLRRRRWSRHPSPSRRRPPRPTTRCRSRPAPERFSLFSWIHRREAPPEREERRDAPVDTKESQDH